MRKTAGNIKFPFVPQKGSREVNIMSQFQLRTMVEIGVMVGIAAVLNFFKLFEMPQGGSVSLEMIPIFIIALRWGAPAGFTAGTLFGVVQLLLGAKIYYPMQAILDYPAAFACLGIAGLFPRYPYLGLTLGSAGRFLAHVLSGVIFFAQWTPEGMNVWHYSLGYNLTYILPELLISMAVLYFLLKRPDFFARAKKVRHY
jgi:thiamine transporter